ncbi:MAG: MFS transporter [Phenylobacterium sp.]|jgi:PAT family beta-lactamase induction signal transducer AmpG|uniref:AmpG family muropeptide MFS transporter n=1 Tax=Phenylobacterium sp. TaxID=1871053 RepID=UPI002A263EAE|nr:MFS transporter [Phenylobacterium sp.]MDD3837632.1 MFS transporter [Phenylobacterium sp.]MDX9997959.1 MFS transporter [Phenylobacterium sp.]
MTADVTSEKKTSTLGAIAVYGERRSLVMLALGFASGLPNLLIFDTLSLWLRDAGLSLKVIAIFSLATLAYSLKFLWAPLIDRTRVPVLNAVLGHRRSWMIVCQGLVMLGLWLISGTNPAASLGLMAAFAVFVGFTAATQDIVIDAWRIEAGTTEKQGALAAAYQWGYRIAMITAGAAPLLLADAFNWNISYGVMAALMLVGVGGALAAPREKDHQIRPIHAEGLPSRPALEIPEWLARLALFALAALVMGSGLAADASLLAAGLKAVGLPGAAEAVTAAWEAKPQGVFFQLAAVAVGLVVIALAASPLPGVRTRPGVYLFSALGDPLRDFFARYRGVAALILALICLYRLPDFVLNIMNPFYADLGFSKTEIAEVRKVFGVVMSVLGVGLGGVAVARLGLLRALVLGAFAGPLSNLVFAWLALQGASLPALFIAIGIDNVASGLSGTCLIAYMSSLTSAGFTATQYALFSSLYALPGKLVASQSGRIVEGAAASADGGGLFAGLAGVFARTPPDAYAQAMEKSGVTPHALGAGYLAFFAYSTLIGVVGIVLAFVVAARQGRAEKAEAEEKAAASA